MLLPFIYVTWLRKWVIQSKYEYVLAMYRKVRNSFHYKNAMLVICYFTKRMS